MFKPWIALSVFAFGIGLMATESFALSEARRRQIYDFLVTTSNFSFNENFERFRASCEKVRSTKACSEGEGVEKVKKEIAVRLYQGAYDTMDCLAQMEDAKGSRNSFDACISKRQESFDNFHGRISTAFKYVTFFCSEAARLREEEGKFPPHKSLLYSAPADTRFVLVKYQQAYDCLRSMVFEFSTLPQK